MALIKPRPPHLSGDLQIKELTLPESTWIQLTLRSHFAQTLPLPAAPSIPAVIVTGWCLLLIKIPDWHSAPSCRLKLVNYPALITPLNVFFIGVGFAVFMLNEVMKWCSDKLTLLLEVGMGHDKWGAVQVGIQRSLVHCCTSGTQLLFLSLRNVFVSPLVLQQFWCFSISLSFIIRLNMKMLKVSLFSRLIFSLMIKRRQSFKTAE